jgi:hypothetical protein
MSAERERSSLELPIAFLEDDGTTVVVNFGILTGREATQAEMDRLAHALHGAGAGDFTITAVRQQEYGDGVETVSHQVQLRAKERLLPEADAICEEWALACADDRRVEPLGT